MATQLFFTNAPASTHRGTNTAKLNSSAAGWAPFALSTARGDTASGALWGASTVTGPTNGVEMGEGTGATVSEFLSDPVSADVTISGTITANIWCSENGMNANIAINVIIDIVRATDGSIVQIVKSTR